MKRELRCLGLGLGLEPAARVLTFAAGGSRERARAQARQWIAEGRVRALMSFGLCGGLDPALAPGTLVVAHRIVLPEGDALGFEEGWARAIAACIPEARVAPLLGVDTVVASASHKRALFEKYAAPALDMESRGVAEAAYEAKIPFVALRAVADPADRSLPSAAADAIDARGRLRPLRVLAGLLSRPRDFAALLLLASDARRGYEALAAARSGALLPDLVPRPAPAPVAAGPMLPDLVPEASRA